MGYIPILIEKEKAIPYQVSKVIVYSDEKNKNVCREDGCLRGELEDALIGSKANNSAVDDFDGVRLIGETKKLLEFVRKCVF